jgi:D-alanine transaminase
MSRIAYVNGRYVPHRDARIHVEDRGFQFADAVYEVVAVKDGVFVDEALHLARLHRSLGELRIPAPMSDAALGTVLREVVRRNGVGEGIVYLQVSRGAAPRDFAFPNGARPSLVVTARRKGLSDPRLIADGVGVITIPDIRWARPDIKSVALLPNVLGKQQAKERGAFEAWQLDAEGCITEGTSSNAWIVTAAGEVVTRSADRSILNGVTRQRVLDLLARHGLTLSERRFSLAEAKAAPEAFLTSASNFIIPVVRIDGAAVGDGRPGPVTQRLAAAYASYAAAGGRAT